MKTILILIIAAVVASPALAVPLERSNRMDHIEFFDLGQGADSPYPPPTTAQGGTTYFGGTVWAADSMRWEALPDSVWTFDSGVGSHFDHSADHVNPFKESSLHAYMEGWVGIDNSYGRENPYFRRLAEDDFPGAVCVGSAAGMQGNASLYCGVLPDEANALCYAGGQGYGDNWKVVIEKAFNYLGGTIDLSFDYANDTEPFFDYSYCKIDTSGFGDTVELLSLNGITSGSFQQTLTPGVDLPYSVGGTIKVQFCVASDGAYSDADGLYPTECGAFAVDNVVLSGALTDSSDFENGDDGWILAPSPPGAGGEWAHLEHLENLPPMMTHCPCNLADSVLVFSDNAGGHGLFKDNIAASPWIDLKAAGKVGAPGKFLTTRIYADVPLLDYIFVQYNIQWYPQICPNTGLQITSAFTSVGVYYYGQNSRCTTAPRPTVDVEFSDYIDPGAEKVRIAVGVISYCRFFANCSGVTNSTPWFDNLALGVYGASGSPFLGASGVDLPYDSFPQNGTLRLDAPGRVDSNNVKGDSQPEIGTSLGDTLIVAGGGAGAGGNTNAEVYIQFAVDWGPGAPQPQADGWLTSHTYEGDWNGQSWYSARMDTAQQGGIVSNSTTWMSAYHETDPHHSGNDEDLDYNDLDPHGHPRLLNDIFPEGNGGLFTMGTRLNIIYKTRYTNAAGQPTTNEWFVFPDTTGGNTLEMEVLPSSAEADSTWNCILYVDHFNRGAQPHIENALLSILGPTTSGNYERTPWDRFDVRAESSQQGSFGRPLNTQYNATIAQTFAYKTILWNSGNLGAFNLVEEDANVLIPWLTLIDPGLGHNNLYLSGDGLAQSMNGEAASEPSARRLLNDWLGVSYTCGTVRDANCPSGTVIDEVACIELASSGGAFPGNDDAVVLVGNGCPSLRSFDVLNTQSGSGGSPAGNELYRGPLKGDVPYHSISNQMTQGPFYRSVLDGASVHYRRDELTCSDPAPVEDRLTRVLDWFGYGSPQICEDPLASLDVDLGDEPEKAAQPTLSAFSPSPLRAGIGAFHTSLEAPALATIQIFDLQGRLIKEVHNGPLEVGNHRWSWNGGDETSRKVANGVYFIRFRTPQADLLQRLVVLN